MQLLGLEKVSEVTHLRDVMNEGFKNGDFFKGSLSLSLSTQMFNIQSKNRRKTCIEEPLFPKMRVRVI